MPRLHFALAGTLLFRSLAALADVSTPHPGLTLVTQPGRAMVIANLCAPGVAVRATTYGERRATPEGWATPLGVKAAVNADFFDFPAASLVDGRARGAGQDWPGDKQFVGFNVRGEDRQYWQFGPKLAELVDPASKAPAPGASEIVGGHNVIIRNGASLAPDFDGDAVILTNHRRTGIGTNKQRTRLYLYADNESINGATMATRMLDMSAEANFGFPDIHSATNEDGGGSSQLYVEGQGQIVTSGRLVANHLGVFASGSGPSPQCPSVPPVGAFDTLDCNFAQGWSQDPDVPTEAINTLLMFDAIFPDPKMKLIVAKSDAPRPDVAKVVGSPNHGFVVPTPYSMFDGTDHPVWALAQDNVGAFHPILGQASKTLRCANNVPKGLKRGIPDPSVLSAWKFDPFSDHLPDVDPSALAALQAATDLGASPILVVNEAKDFFLVDGGGLRKIMSEASAAAWHFDLTKATPRTASELAAMPVGPPLRFRPMLARAKNTAAIYLIDALPGETAPAQMPASDAGLTTTPPVDESGAPFESGKSDEGCRSSGAPSGSAGIIAVGAALLLLVRRRRA